MLSKTFSAALNGIEGNVIEIQAARQAALPNIVITGMAGEIVKESRERVRACLTQLGFEVPSSRLLVHLSPASSKKQGSQLDLAIALSVLAAEGILPPHEVVRFGFLGELLLDGRLKGVAGALSLMQCLIANPSVEEVIVPKENAAEAALLNHPKIKLASTMGEVLDYLSSKGPLEIAEVSVLETPKKFQVLSFDSIVGQNLAKRALQIAVAGNHHTLLVGPPGVGKSLLAQAAAALLPPLEKEEEIVVSKNFGFESTALRERHQRPFRSPHHSISNAGLLGGGTGAIRPGEVTLAHSGILFLDEFPEFRKDVVEGLREPLQTGRMDLRRVGLGISLPAKFLLIAAMNPCPCGYALSVKKRCVCAPEKRLAYQRKISGPILDRMDLCVQLSFPKSQQTPKDFTHAVLLETVMRAIETQKARYRELGNLLRNADGQVPLSHPCFRLPSDASDWFHQVTESEEISYRALHKWIRVARTIADLEGADGLTFGHLREAWGYRSYECLQARFNW